VTIGPNIVRVRNPLHTVEIPRDSVDAFFVERTRWNATPVITVKTLDGSRVVAWNLSLTRLPGAAERAEAMADAMNQLLRSDARP
jgi:hypothetical protein